MSTTTQLFNNLPPFTQATGNILPLTTIFTPPQDCTAATAYTPELWPAGSSSAFKYVFLNDDGVHTSSCYPSSYSKYQHDKGIYYSPGVCPLEWEYVATSVQSDVDDSPLTLAMCCPSGIHYLIENKEACSYVYTTPQPGLSIAWPTFSHRPGSNTTLFAQRLAVAWRESDLAMFTPASAPLKRIPAITSSSITMSSTTTVSPATGVVTTGPSLTSSPESSPSASSLTTGAKVGTAVGAKVGALCLLGGLLYLFIRSRRKRRAESNCDTNEGTWTTRQELDGKHTQLIEVSYTCRPFETDGNVRYELDGGWEVPEAGRGWRSPG